MYSLRLLGVIALEGPSGPVSGRVAQRRRLALLALLGAAAERGWTRERLVGLLWPDASDDQARHLLSDSVYVIRQALGEDSIITSGDVVRLNSEAVATDVERFEAAIKNGELKEAVELYRGPFIDGFYVGDALELERWVEVERARLAGLYAKALEALAQQAEDTGEYPGAVGWWQRLAAHDPYDSRISLRLMQAFVGAGNPAGALEHARVHELLVREELGVEPAAELMQVVERLKQEPRPVAELAAETTATIDPMGATRAASEATAARLVHEIHRRFLWQVLLIYVGGTWTSYEIIERISERLALPTWLPLLAIILFLIGMPFVLATAFVQEGLPLKAQADRTPISVSGGARTAGSRTRGARRLFTWRNAIAGGVVAMALWGVAAAGILAFTGRAAPTVELASVERKSIAVLPLANLSGDAGTDPFVQGIHDDIVTHLSKIGDLRPISRTSVMEYANTTKNLKQIAQELGVATVLEGGVQRSGNRVRINIQLIDAATDEHIWAEVYEEDLTAQNVFTIQTTIARRIAAALKAQLTPEEQERLAERPTDNLEAYEAYLRGKANPPGIRMLERAVELDPGFAAAWADIARVRLLQAWATMDKDARASGISALDRATELAPAAFETQMARAEYHRRVTQDLDAALEALRAAEAVRPNDADLLMSRGITLRIAGRWDEALATFERAARLDPLNADVARDLGATSHWLGRFADAERYYDRAIALSPSNPRFYAEKFDFLLTALGDTARARALADTVGASGLVDRYPSRYAGWLAQLDYVRRDYETARDVIISQRVPRGYALLTSVYYATNDRERLLGLADSLRIVRQGQLDEALKAEAPPTVIAFSHANLGIQYSYLGQREAAIREAEQATETFAASTDAINYPRLLFSVALIYVRTGDHDRAIDLLETTLSAPHPWTAAWLALDPDYDPLRGHPRFQALLRKQE